jgi:hypothetical protein
MIRSLFTLTVLTVALCHAVVLHRNKDTCNPPPFCDGGNRSWPQWVSCRAGLNPLGEGEYMDYVAARLDRLLHRNVKGQDHIIEDIRKDVLRKLRQPHHPLVMHFAGDNGVGKTSTALWISAAMSLRCHRSVKSRSDCNMGDNVLSLSGVSYENHPSFREEIVKSILKHARQYPHGVIVFNDVTALSESQVRVLLPLLGRSTHFVEDPSVDLRLLTVIITTDFGVEGRTRGKSLQEVVLMVQEEVRTSWGTLAGSEMRTYPFLPASLETVTDIVHLAVSDWLCTFPVAQLTSVGVQDDVLDSLTHSNLATIASENGRAVSNAVRAALVSAELDSPLPSPKDGTSSGPVHGDLVVVKDGTLQFQWHETPPISSADEL